MNSRWIFLLFVGYVLLVTSCASPKRITYVQDMGPDLPYKLNLPEKEVKLMQDDKLSITVSSKNPELVVPFNIGVGSYAVSSDGDVSSAMSGSTTLRERGYVVDRKGEIEFPILGKIKAEGLTPAELGEQIKSRLIKDNLVSDPMITIDLLNKKITVLGEVGSVGVQTINDTRVTLLDAIARSGGITNNGRMDNVVVIREQDGVRSMIETDLKSVDLFDSPAFFLQQNDIVYVRPIASRPTPKSETNWRYLSMGMTILTLITSILAWTK